MKIIEHSGDVGAVIIIEQPTDIYSLLDWCQDTMVDLQGQEAAEVNRKKWRRAILYLSKLMKKVKEDGFIGDREF